METGLNLLVAPVSLHHSQQNQKWDFSFKDNTNCCSPPQITSTYSAFFGQVQDIAFLPGGDEFISAAEVIKRNSTDKGIMAWDSDQRQCYLIKYIRSQ